MTFYPGGKKRLGGEIATVIHDYASKQGDWRGYYEPFCGMLGVYRHMPERLDVTDWKAGDKNSYVIDLWQALQGGWIPPTKACPLREYTRIQGHHREKSQCKRRQSPCKRRQSPGKRRPSPGKMELDLDAIFYGFACSYRGDFMSGYFDRNNVANQAEDCVEIANTLSRVKFSCGNYDQFDLSGYIIYADPPYRDTKNNYYEGRSVRRNSFDYDRFIEWCRIVAQDNLVFISEYSRPCKEAKLIWSSGKEQLYVM